ncbi:hypothetical protein CMI47_07060 [Candidatus Pacearchaeota archaeon]|mgnify:CR=1 FL=1|jgi:hypothetical protein|nr:hypothetical protein [Candidatus Pacearchaeota archaeon]|tara:strand:+ start:3360 stop:5600 length:2241 start_codon:yes stop_codon:yes gene_type:complete
MAKVGEKADRIRNLFNSLNNAHRIDWESINQEGYDFYLDNQLSKQEVEDLQDQGMPTFTVNRIIPVVEMLDFYATANSPRWQAVGTEGSDSDVAAVFSDVADYIWQQSDGSTLYSNVINDAVTKSIGYMMVDVDSNADRGMGEVILRNPNSFDIYVDPKSRDPLFRDASHVLIRKILPKTQLINLYPEYSAKIKRASGNYSEFNYSPNDANSADFQINDINMAFDRKGGDDPLIDYIECYEKESRPYWNVFIQIPPTREALQKAQEQVDAQLKEMSEEMEVQIQELQNQLQQGVEAGEVLPDRMQLEIEKAVKQNEAQLAKASEEMLAKAQQELVVTENQVVPDKVYKVMLKDEMTANYIVDAVKFYKKIVKLTCIVGDQLLKEKDLPTSHYPIVPFTYKWTGTPFPLSAVSPLVGKQKEINKAHQLMVHNASLGSSLRWMYEEGSVDTAYWEKYSSAPGALLPVNSGYETPTPVLPMQLSNAFANIVEGGKNEMEYLAGIWSNAMGNPSEQSETYRGMLAMDEYGTRRVKQWMKSSIEPALVQLGKVVKDYSQAVYKAHKVFRLVQPNDLQEEGKQVEMNIPIYNDMGEAVGKYLDYETGKFDVKIVAGSTLPVNRWAYLAELKELLKLGVVDDIAVLAETDVRQKTKIAQRKSLYAQMQGQIAELEEKVKDQDGIMQTLERQLVQSGIKAKVMQVENEVRKSAGDAQLKMRDTARGMASDREQTADKLRLIEQQAKLQGKANGS